MNRDKIKAVLAEICEAAEDVLTAFTSKKSVYKILRKNFGVDYSDRKCKRYLYDLERRGYLHLSKESVVLTNKAKIKVIEKISKNFKKDGVLRFFSFDIPESMSSKRNRFRKILKKMGCAEIQKSLWATDKDLGDIIDDAISELEIENYVAYIVSKTTNINEFVREKLTNN